MLPSGGGHREGGYEGEKIGEAGALLAPNCPEHLQTHRPAKRRLGLVE